MLTIVKQIDDRAIQSSFNPALAQQQLNQGQLLVSNSMIIMDSGQIALEC